MGLLNTVLKSYRDQALAKPESAEEIFADLAYELMTDWEFAINDVPHWLVELEVYFHNAGHPDPYVHRAPAQAETGEWYFHREKSATKSFTLKGLDLTFGQAESRVHAGILVRAISQTARPAKASDLVQGPSKVVDHILDAYGVESVMELKPVLEENPESLDLRPAKAALARSMYLAPRFGLKLKAEGADPGGGFHGANYRFRAEPGLAKASQGKTAILAGKRHSPPPARQPPHPAPPLSLR